MRGRGGDRTGLTLSAQDARVVAWLSTLALAGWTVLSMTDGAVDLGRLPAGAGATALAWGLVGAALLALGAVVRSRRSTLGGPAALGLGAIAALVAWSAASITWAPAPNLAWLATNRITVALAAMVIGVALAIGTRDPARRLAIGIAVAAVPVLGWALASRVVPELLSRAGDAPRLAAPIGHANTLALVAVFAVPGALCLAAARRWRPAGATIAMVALLVVAMSGSRSGILALAATVTLALWLQDDRPSMLASLGAAVAGAVPAAVYALGAEAFTTEPILDDPATRRGAGLVLGALIIIGIAIAATMGDVLAPFARRVALWIARPAAGRLVLVVTGCAILAGIVVSAAIGRDAEPGATRVLTLNTNNRTAWWGQAWRGFLDQPLTGGGAGSFPLTHIAERTVAVENLQVRQPHQLGLELLTELGIVGLALGLAAVGAVVWAARRTGRAAAPAVALVAAFLVQAQLDIPWTSPAATIPAMAAAGVVVAMGARHHTVRRGVSAGRVGVVTVLAFGASLSALWLWNGERRTTDAYLIASTNPIKGAAMAHEAAEDAPLSIGAFLVEARTLLELGDRSGAIAAARRAAERQPDHPFAWECLATVATGSQREEAIARWSELDPRRLPATPPACQAGW